MGSPITPPRLFAESFEALHQAAVEQSGLADFGPSDYHEGLRRVLTSFDEDVLFTPDGREQAFVALVRTLVARLHVQEGWRRHPDYASERIVRPLVITGLPRTGSTALHKLLSMDPQFQGIEMWLSNTPMVRPPRDKWPSYPGYRDFLEFWNRLTEKTPDMTLMHEMVVDEVDECVNVLQQSFVCNRFTTSYGATGYEAWWWRQSERESYRRYADVVRLVGLGDRRRWLLKNPGHLLNMDCLLEVFPDACVIQTHRDPAKSIPSVCSLLWTSRRMFVGDNHPPGSVGVPEALKWLHALHRAEPVRRSHEDQFHDVLHRDFLADPMRVVKEIYHRFDLELGEETDQRMKRWLASQKPEQKGGHRYQAETFGLSEQGLRELFAPYIDRFDLAPPVASTSLPSHKN